MVPCCHIYKISFSLSDLCLHLQNLIFIWCLVVKFTESHKVQGTNLIFTWCLVVTFTESHKVQGTDKALLGALYKAKTQHSF